MEQPLKCKLFLHIYSLCTGRKAQCGHSSIFPTRKSARRSVISVYQKVGRMLQFTGACVLMALMLL